VIRFALLASLLVASSAFGAWNPVFSSTYEELTVGETKVIELRATASGFGYHDFVRWICVSTIETVAYVEGGLGTSTATGKVRITAIAPGRAWIRIRHPGERFPSSGRFVQIVVRPAPLSVSIMPSASISIAGQPVVLTAITEGSPHTVQWYRGRLGDLSHPLDAGGDEVTVTPMQPGLAHYWVLIIGAQGTSSAEIAIDVRNAPRRRAAGHSR
jgi:hypothetical protein